MRDIVKIAWRNLWRNKRRTLITAASIFFAIFFAICMRSFQLGTYGHMIKQVIESFTGYLQIQSNDYFDDPGIDNAFQASPDLLARISADPNVKVAVPRIESFALVSTGNLSKGIIVAGISPEKERELSNPEQKLVRYRFTQTATEHILNNTTLSKEMAEDIKSLNNQSFISKELLMAELGLKKKDSLLLKEICLATAMRGSYLKEADEGVLISDNLSKYLRVGVGDSIVLMGQGYQGVSAADVFPIRGIVRIPAPDLDNKLIYMSIDKASEFFSLSDQFTYLAINLFDTDDMKETQERLAKLVESDQLSVKNWEETAPVMKQQIEGDSKSGQAFLAILYIIIFFGIFGTVQMMISERRHEFGMMVAIGMKRGKLATIVTIEMLFLGFIGAAAGMLASVPVILLGYYYPFKLTGEMAEMYMDYGFDPIMPLAWFEEYFFTQGGVIFLMVILASYLPIRQILKLDLIKALHGN